MKTAFKMKGMDFGNSPLKQDVKISTGFGKQADANLSKKVNQSNTKANTTTPKVNKKPTSTLGRITKTFKNTPKQFAKGGKEILKTTNRNLVSGGKQILKKGAKFLGGKALGVASMMTATSSKADQPTYKSTGDPKYKKGESKQIKDLLTKHKLKGGRN